MIDPTTLWGKTIVVFFWSGLSASLVNMAWSFWHFNPFCIAWAVVLTNMFVVYLKNRLLPPK